MANIMIDADSWKSFYAALKEQIEPYIPYYEGYEDALDNVDAWFDSQATDGANTAIRSKLDYVDRKVILAYAENNMRAKWAAKQLGVYWNLVYRRLDTIWDKTGLNPRNFYDLHKLTQIIKAGGNDG